VAEAISKRDGRQRLIREPDRNSAAVMETIKDVNALIANLNISCTLMTTRL
jgi:hypothetical protein